MAVQAIAKSTKATIRLFAGTDPESGKALYKNVTLSGLRSNPDGEKVYAVVDAAAPCLAHTVSGVTTTEIKTLEKIGG
jgi:type IV secretory pathway VirJ component